jgi:hypothetical protein
MAWVVVPTNAQALQEFTTIPDGLASKSKLSTGPQVHLQVHEMRSPQLKQQPKQRQHSAKPHLAVWQTGMVHALRSLQQFMSRQDSLLSDQTNG